MPEEESSGESQEPVIITGAEFNQTYTYSIGVELKDLDIYTPVLEDAANVVPADVFRYVDSEALHDPKYDKDLKDRAVIAIKDRENAGLLERSLSTKLQYSGKDSFLWGNPIKAGQGEDLQYKRIASFGKK